MEPPASTMAIAALGEMRSPAQVAQNRGISVNQVFNG